MDTFIKLQRHYPNELCKVILEYLKKRKDENKYVLAFTPTWHQDEFNVKMITIVESVKKAKDFLRKFTDTKNIDKYSLTNKPKLKAGKKHNLKSFTYDIMRQYVIPNLNYEKLFCFFNGIEETEYAPIFWIIKSKNPVNLIEIQNQLSETISI